MQGRKVMKVWRMEKHISQHLLGTSNLKDSNMIFGDNTNLIQSNLMGTSNLNLTLRKIWDSYLHLMGIIPIKEMMRIDLIKGVKVLVSAENAYSMRRMLGPPQVQLDFYFALHKVELEFVKKSIRVHDIILNQLQTSSSLATTLGRELDDINCFKNIEQSPSLSFVIDPNVRNLPIFLQSHSNSMASDILATALQSAEARDSATFLTSVPILSRYNGFALSVMKAVVSMSQPSSHVLHSAILVTGPVFKEHLYAYLYA
ncbi:hypothetical protein V6N11_082958 [Hibiscus sabdariffa]|uniref:Uncharacterized protein n=1 Tax=Hibiscus sabdariffa TaxID=183260 RepID=A0ABR2QKG8_9ROSI